MLLMLLVVNIIITGITSSQTLATLAVLLTSSKILNFLICGSLRTPKSMFKKGEIICHSIDGELGTVRKVDYNVFTHKFVYLVDFGYKIRTIEENQIS